MWVGATQADCSEEAPEQAGPAPGLMTVTPREGAKVWLCGQVLPLPFCDHKQDSSLSVNVFLGRRLSGPK